MRAPSPGKRYDQDDEAAFRRLVELEVNRALTELNIGGANFFMENGVLKVKGTAGTITIVGPA